MTDTQLATAPRERETTTPMSDGAAFIDGEYVPIAEARIPILDWGFLRSDATYDVVSVWDGRFFRLEDHLDRFERSVARLRMKLPYGRDQIRDIVFECVGKKGLINFACDLVRTQGKVVGVGLCVGGDEWDPFAILNKEITIVMAAFFSMAEFAMAIDALATFETFRPQALITEKIGLGHVPEAFEALRNRTTQCKVLIDVAA